MSGETFSFVDQNKKSNKVTEVLIRSFVSIQQCALGTCFFERNLNELLKLTVT